MADTTFLNNVDKDTVTKLLDTTEENTQYFTSITDSVVTAYTAHLDTLMQTLYKQLQTTDIADIDLEKECLELTNLLYFLGTKLEQVGIHDDVSKAARDEVFNRVYLDNQVKDAERKNKTTVAELTALAQEGSKYESVVNSIYNRAYRIIKYKIDAGYKMVDVLRKLISKRMQDEQLSMYQPKTITPQMEDQYE